MESNESRRTTVPLAIRASGNADAVQIADTVVSAWQDIDAALSTIIGRQGVAALYRRSLHLAAANHAWLAAPQQENGLQSEMALAALKAALARQNVAEAETGGSALLQAFHRLLASMIGPSLTEQLLGSIWARLFSGPPAQEPTP